jgi:NADH-quinone oxidoreductase subunit H
MLEWLQSQLGFSIILAAGLLGVILGTVAYAMFYERKVAGWIQDRYGPNRAGPFGLLQPIADGVKALFKEDIIPHGVDRPLFILAPGFIFFVALVEFAVIPWAGGVAMPNGNVVQVQVASLDIGLLYILAIASMSVYGIVLGAWASNNKYSFYGGMRAAAQMLSYEIPMGLAILTIVLTVGELRLEKIVAAQMAGSWNILLHPIAGVVLFITALAEANRTPFDLAECEQELVGGYHTEYSGMKFALFFLAEYAHIITTSALMAVLLLGGWELFPFASRLGWGWLDWIHTSTDWKAAIIRFAILYGKVIGLIFVYMWVRWTIPRFRFDQLMRLAWTRLVPITLATATLAGALTYFGRAMSVWATAGNVVILIGILGVMSRSRVEITGRQSRMPRITAGSGVSR